jgi:hypothetical protein
MIGMKQREYVEKLERQYRKFQTYGKQILVAYY